ncbi:hypothetical protein V1477_019535 [Vespula maculifrons]|uniref:Uncharacterized protein n=2 Tax=Vespula TaxID=7451 RepID=A0A834J592_VESGE|nr:hypothetical protein HZH68_015676 [Vespula germanica]
MASDSRPDDTGHELTEPSRGTVADIQTGGRSTVGAPALLEEEPWFVLLPTDAVNRRRQADASTSAPSQEEGNTLRYTPSSNVPGSYLLTEIAIFTNGFISKARITNDISDGKSPLFTMPDYRLDLRSQ